MTQNGKKKLYLTYFGNTKPKYLLLTFKLYSIEYSQYNTVHSERQINCNYVMFSINWAHQMWNLSMKESGDELIRFFLFYPHNFWLLPTCVFVQFIYGFHHHTWLIDFQICFWYVWYFLLYGFLRLPYRVIALRCYVWDAYRVAQVCKWSCFLDRHAATTNIFVCLFWRAVWQICVFCLAQPDKNAIHPHRISCRE